MQSYRYLSHLCDTELSKQYKDLTSYLRWMWLEEGYKTFKSFPFLARRKAVGLLLKCCPESDRSDWILQQDSFDIYYQSMTTDLVFDGVITQKTNDLLLDSMEKSYEPYFQSYLDELEADYFKECA